MNWPLGKKNLKKSKKKSKLQVHKYKGCVYNRAITRILSMLILTKKNSENNSVLMYPQVV